MTQVGLNKLKSELEDLKSKLQPAIDRVSIAREQGDLSENFEYHAAREDHANIVGRIEEITDIVNRAEIIDTAPKSNGAAVDIGSLVTVEINGSTHNFTIVGNWEADPEKKMISHESPLGKALLGKTPGEKVEVEAPAGKIIYTVKEVK